MERQSGGRWLRRLRGWGCGVVPTRTFDLLSLQPRLLVVDGLAGEREDPDFRHFPQQILLAAAQLQYLATLWGVLHHLKGPEDTLKRVLQPGLLHTHTHTQKHTHTYAQLFAPLGPSELLASSL